MPDIVVPGAYLGSAETYKSGEGTYVRFCQVYANRAGYKVVEKVNENVCSLQCSVSGICLCSLPLMRN
jgi:exosome complex RNA-binding protein Rrp4